jgi:uncharacterized protein (DUF2062 family)
VSKKLKGFLHRFLLKPILDQIKQGADAKSLATTVAAGTTIAIFPILGATTALCAVIGVRWKLNQPVLQLVNYFLYPVQILMIPVFLYLGSKLWGVEPVSINPETILMEFKSNTALFFSNYGLAGLRGVIVWLILSPLVYYPIRTGSFFVLSRIIRQKGMKQNATRSSIDL